MKKNISKILVAIVFAITGALAVFGVAKADEEISSTVTVSPMTQKIILTPGESYEGSIKVSNPNSAKSNLDYSVHIGSFSQHKDAESADDYGTVDTDSKTTYNQMMDWIVLGKESGSVAPNNTDVISFVINVPADAPAGGQYATLIVRDETDHSGGGGGNVSIQSISQIASIVYAEVAGETRNEGSIIENEVPGFLMNNVIETTSMVRNDGNIHTDAEYILQVWPMFGDEEICTNEEDPAKSLVMPETERYHTESCTLPAVGIFRAKQTVKIFGETSIVEKTVIICPVWLLFIIIFVIFALIFYFAAKAKARKKAAKKQQKS